VTKLDEAEKVTEHYLDVLDKVKAAGLDAQISVKPTQLGLDLDAVQCQRNLDRICEKAERLGNVPMWIDMENSPYVDPTLQLYRKSKERYNGVGIAIQAYLHRSLKDIESLIPLGPAIRIVKGAYLEPPEVAFPKKSDVDENFYTLCVRLLKDDAQKTGTLLHIATHDIALADRITAYIDQHKVPSTCYEYAMLYGIQRAQQQRLAQGGRRIRVLISYGEYWYPWYMRRLAERPANVTFVLKNLFGR
jgi:proline dehydrogenase